MDLHLFVPPPLHSIITVFFILILVPSSYSQDYEKYMECVLPYQCGAIKNVTYPFWGDHRPEYCGHKGFELNCTEEYQYPVIDIADLKFLVLNISQEVSTMRIARMDLWDDVCADINTTLNYSLFNYTGTNQNLSLFYDCSSEVPITVPYFNCSIKDDDLIYYVNDSTLDGETLFKKCKKRIIVPVLNSSLDQLSSGSLKLQAALFDVEYHEVARECGACENSSYGICGYNSTFLCLCGNKLCRNPVAGLGMKLWKELAIGIGAGVAGILIMCIINFCFKTKTSSLTSMVFFRKKDQDLEAFIRSYGTLALKRYSFSSIKKMTNSFKDKLGQGGYGGVYKGKLLDGRLVAVKVLNASKGNGEEFINEVASISRTSHVNIVTLLGFCLEVRKRALIYEFMPNGSLEKFIHNDNTLTSKNKSQHLGWEKLYQIAIGIARGLEYLHRGCNTRILHLDIKPHNILLDEDFCPKISDFGLAKLCTRKESIISMLEARGTIGYIAPEVFSRIFGGVSHKSDVYSYGMMILEMVGGSKNMNVGVNHSSEIYFPHWVYKRLEVGTEFEWHGVTTDEETEIVRKMILVGLWCIQTSPSDRPSMSKVIEMLEGSIGALEIPPRPFLSSHPRSPNSDPSTTSLS